MTSNTDVPLTVPSLKSVDVIRLVYEKFRPITKNCGPLSAGEVSIDGKQGSLYLAEYQYWLWSGTSATKELTHPEVDAVTTPQALVRSLLASTAGKIKAFEAHLDRIEQRATDIPSMVGYYLSNDGETIDGCDRNWEPLQFGRAGAMETHQEIRSGEMIAPNSEGETFVVSPSPHETSLQTAPPL